MDLNKIYKNLSSVHFQHFFFMDSATNLVVEFVFFFFNLIMGLLRMTFRVSFISNYLTEILST